MAWIMESMIQRCSAQRFAFCSVFARIMTLLPYFHSLGITFRRV
jgi:hypothetical protein